MFPNVNPISLSDEQIAFYRKNGFIQIDHVLSDEELGELRQCIEEAMGAEDGRAVHTSQTDGVYYRVLNQKVNTWRDHAGMANYVFHPRFADLALQLTGASGIRLFHDHALWKMPGDSKPTPWHQDFPYWPMEAPGALSIWIALDDVDESNGCMMFVPKSHQAGKLQPISLSDPQNLFDYVQDEELASDKAVICRMKAGSCTFHHGQTFHYAHANATDRPRRVLAIIFTPDDIVYNGKTHVITDHTYMKQGEPFHGGLFPLLAARRA